MLCRQFLKSRSYLSHTATLAREDRLCRMTARAPLYSDDKAPVNKIPAVSYDNIYANAKNL